MGGAQRDLLDSELELRRAVFDELRAGVGDPKNPWHWPTLVTDLGGRIVVSRDYDERAAFWQFFSDRRADKVQQFTTRAEAEVVFYDGTRRWQLRLRGQVKEIVDKGLRQNLWESQSTLARSNYATTQPPGTVLESPSEALPFNWPDDPALVAQAFANFGVFRVEITQYEFLQLGREQTLRCRWGNAEGSFNWLTP